MNVSADGTNFSEEVRPVFRGLVSESPVTVSIPRHSPPEEIDHFTIPVPSGLNRNGDYFPAKIFGVFDVLKNFNIPKSDETSSGMSRYEILRRRS